MAHRQAVHSQRNRDHDRVAHGPTSRVWLQGWVTGDDVIEVGVRGALEDDLEIIVVIHFQHVQSLR